MHLELDRNWEKRPRRADFRLALGSQRNQHMLESAQNVQWILHRADRCLTCVERVTPSGYECSVLYDGLRVAVRVLPMEQDAEAWAAHIRSEWESAGWLSIGAKAESAAVPAPADGEGRVSRYQRVLDIVHRVVDGTEDQRGTADASLPDASTC
jgi:hypothetical protein